MPIGKSVPGSAPPTSRPTTPTSIPQDSGAGLPEDKGTLKTAKKDYTVRVTESGEINKPVDHTQSHGAAKKDLRERDVRPASGEQKTNQKLPKKTLTKEERELKRREKQARLGQKVTAEERENYLYNIGMKASLDPSKSWRTLAQRGPTTPPPGGVESLQNSAVSAHIKRATELRGADAAQKEIDQATADKELYYIKAITNPTRGEIKTKQNKKSKPEKPKSVAMSEKEIVSLRSMAQVNRKLAEVLKIAEKHGYEVGNVDGQVSLIIGGMAYPVAQQIDLLHQLFCNDKKRIIFGWCVGNKRHNKPEALTRTLAAHEPLLGRRMSVHSAAYQASWNPDLIQAHFGDSAEKVKVEKCAGNRVADAESYIYIRPMHKE